MYKLFRLINIGSFQVLILASSLASAARAADCYANAEFIESKWNSQVGSFVAHFKVKADMCKRGCSGRISYTLFYTLKSGTTGSSTRRAFYEIKEGEDVADFGDPMTTGSINPSNSKITDVLIDGTTCSTR